jgi:hypothetical protein
MLARFAVAHRQDGERPAGQELLLRHPAMRQRVARHEHDRDLVVRPGACADAGILAHRTLAALGRGDQPRNETATAPQDEIDLVGRAHGVDGFVGRHQLDRRTGGEPAQDRGAQKPVLDDPSHRGGRRVAGIGFAVVEMKEERTGSPVVPCVGDADVEDRFSKVGNVGPDTQRLEQTLARVGDRRRAAVEARVGHRLQRQAVDQRRPQARLASGKRQQAAVEAGPHDRHIEAFAVHGHVMAARRSGGNPDA